MAKNWQPGDRAVYKGQQVHILECGTAVGTLENENGRRIDGVFLEDLKPIGTVPRSMREKAEIDAMKGPPPGVLPEPEITRKEPAPTPTPKDPKS